MAREGIERRLTVILCADVVEYSRLMAVDEAGTFAQLKTLRKELIEPKTAEYNGHVIKLTGDGTLMEFASVVDTVNFAVDVQQAMTGRNANVPDNLQIRYRVGINIGEVIVDEDDIYGDGVNIAARLEGLAEPGGICISDKVYEEVRNKLPTIFEDLGEQEVKNIPEPVRMYRWTDAAADPMPATAGVGGQLPLPEKPSIAVLPFTNMSGDPEQEYFSDGITEDIITELSRFRSLFVIARNSSFVFKGGAVNVSEVGRKLGVAYVVEGSVRKAGNRVRITAQLVEAATGNHLWAERYDRDLEDIFAVQDEVTQTIASILPRKLDDDAVARARRKPTNNMSAYDYLLRGEWYTRINYGDPRALEMFEKAVEIDPRCARAYVRMAVIELYWVFGGAAAEPLTLRAREHVESALGVNEDDSSVHWVAAVAYLLLGQHDRAKLHSDRAIALNPNDVDAILFHGYVTTYLGDAIGGLEWMARAQRLDPYQPESTTEDWMEAYYMSGQYEKAIEAFQQWRNPQFHMYSRLAACYAQLDRMDEARSARAEYERRWPEGFDSAESIAAHMRMCASQEDRDHWLEGYRKAGVEV